MTKKSKPSSGKQNEKSKATKEKSKVSYQHKPEGMGTDEWQIALRKQIAEKEFFTIERTGTELVYSDYAIHNTQSGNTYKVALRSKDPGLNYCSCPDFKVNGLGTCKHIEAIWLQIHKKRGIKKLIHTIPELPYSSIYLSYPGERKIKVRIGTEDKAAFESWAKKYFDKGGVLKPSAFLSVEKLLKEASLINSSFRCYDDALNFIIDYREKNKREELIRKSGTTLLKDLVNVPLFPYQQEGVLFATKAGRSILADDMGLGKTIQAIAYAILMRKNFGTQKVLIICPTSLKYQWKTEIQKFSPEQTVTVVEGHALIRKRIYQDDESYFKVISYHVAGNDKDLINKMQPDIIILDEAQRIKNWKTKISQNVKRLLSPHALVLTGTPMENNIEELFSLVQFVNPFLLGSLYNFVSSHQIKEAESGKITGYKNLNEIGEILSPVLLRRRKKEVLTQLPKRVDKVLFVPMTEEQSTMHDEFADIVAKIVHKWRNQGFLNENDRKRLLLNLGMMRMVCDTTYILDQKTNHQTKIDELFNILDELFEMEGEKVVIFSQWERMTRLIAKELDKRNIGYQYLHGGVPSQKREALFTHFNQDDKCRVFLSTDAGGVGLNLQAASYLFNMDIPWNPAVLEQRIARIYRMGQKKNVSITNIVSQGTIEERMLSVLKFKSSLAAGILDNGEDSIFVDDKRFQKFMESIESLTDENHEEKTTFDSEEKEEIALTDLDHQIESIQELIDIEENTLTEQGQETERVAIASNTTTSPTDLLQNGMNFFTQLIHTLSDQSKVKELTESITEKDEKTGQTFIKLPVENIKTVESTLNLLGSLLKNFGQK